MMARLSVLVWSSLACLAGGCGNGGVPSTDPYRAVLNPDKFVGQTITVFLDGRQTEATKDTSPLTWTVEPISGNPTVRFSVDDVAFGLPIRRVGITIHPFAEDKVDQEAFYRPTEHPIHPDQELRLPSFEYIGRNQYQKVTKLPPGQYRFVIHVIGQRNRDRQIILFTVE